MDITCLCPTPALPLKGDVLRGKGADVSFESEGIAPEKLAPPGTAPPPNPGQMPAGEEGAILEPNAPTQNPDFFPNFKTEGETPPSDPFAKPAVAKRSSRTEDPAKGPTSEIGVDTLLKGFEAVFKLGPIVVPNAIPATFEPTPAPVPVFGAKGTDAVDAVPMTDGLKAALAKEAATAASALPDGPLATKASPRKPKDGELSEANPSNPGTETKPPTVPPKPEVRVAAPSDERRKPSVEGEKPFELTAGRRIREHGPMRPGPDMDQPQEALFRTDDLAALKIDDVPLDGDDRLLGRWPVGPSTDQPDSLSSDQADTALEKDVFVIPKPQIDPIGPNKAGIEAKPVSNEARVEEPKPTAEKDSDSLDPAEASTKPRRMKREAVENELKSAGKEAPLREAKAKDTEPVGRPFAKDEVAAIHANRSERTNSPVPMAGKPAERLNDAQTRSILDQVSERLDSLAASQSNRRVTIRLEPESFGSITLVVRQSGSDVNAEVYASHDSVRAALEVNRAHLAANLDQRGIQLGSMTVGHELPHHSGRQEQAMREAAKQHSQFFAGKPETTPLSLEAMRSFARKPSGVDLWI